MTRRRLTILLLLTTILATITVFPSAQANIYDNVAPEPQTHGKSENYPAARYALDSHVDLTETPDTHAPGSGGLIGSGRGIVDSLINIPRTQLHIEDAPAIIEHRVANVIWGIDRLLTDLVLALFAFAFSLDLVGGNHGVLQPISNAVNRLYDELGREWMALALGLTAAYAAYQMLWLRRIASTFGTLFVSMIMVFAAMLLITQTDWTMGGAARLNTDLSNAILGAVNGDDSTNAKTAAVDAFHEQFITIPYTILNFGGVEHCTNAKGEDVKPKSPDCLKKNHINNLTKYTDRWLAAGNIGSKARDLEYKAIKEGEAPSSKEIEDAGLPKNAFDGYHLSKADSPAIDIQEAGGADDRLEWAAGIFVASFGAKLLIGGLAIGVILKSVLALLLFAFAPIMAILALFPGAGQRAFRSWFIRMFLLLFAACWAALLLAATFAVSRALMTSSADLGFGLSWSLVAFFFWMVLFYRKELEAFLLRAVAGEHGDTSTGRTVGQRARDLHYTSRVALPVAAAGVGGVTLAAVGAGKVAGATGRNAAEGVGMIRDRVRAEGADGHTKKMVAVASVRDRAIKSLDRDHQHNVDKLSGEEERRKRVKELQNRDGIAKDAIRMGEDASGLMLKPGERKELADLNKNAMDVDEYKGLRSKVLEMEERKQGGDDVIWPDAEVAQRAADIQARDQARRARKEADYTQRNSGGGDMGDWDDVPDRSSRKVADRARRAAKAADSELHQFGPRGAGTTGAGLSPGHPRHEDGTPLLAGRRGRGDGGAAERAARSNEDAAKQKSHLARIRPRRPFGGAGGARDNQRHRNDDK